MNYEEWVISVPEVISADSPGIPYQVSQDNAPLDPPITPEVLDDLLQNTPLP